MMKVRVTRSSYEGYSVHFSDNRNSYSLGVELEDEKEIEEITLLLQEYSRATEGLDNWVFKTQEAEAEVEARRKAEKEAKDAEAKS